MKPPTPVQRKEPDPPDLVLRWFQTCWPKAKRHPGPAACWHVVLTLRSVCDARARALQPSPEVLVALKHARLFALHAPLLARFLRDRAESRRLRWEAGQIVADDDAYADALAVVAQLNQAVRAAKKAQDAIKASGLLAPWRVRQPERSIHEAALVAWHTVPSAERPARGLRSMNPSDPLCQFIELALAAIRMKKSRSEISKVLKGKRRPP